MIKIKAVNPFMDTYKCAYCSGEVECEWSGIYDSEYICEDWETHMECEHCDNTFITTCVFDENDSPTYYTRKLHDAEKDD